MQSQKYMFLLLGILHQSHSIFLGAGTNKFMKSSLQGCEQCSKFWRTVVSSSSGSHSPGRICLLLLQNAGYHSTNGTQSHPWRPKSSATPPWKLQISHTDKNDRNLWQLEKRAFADVCTLTFWTCPASAVSQQNLQIRWWMTRKQLLFPASVNRNILIHEVVLQATGYTKCKQFILLHR
jgi:hypothetical protein